MNYCIYGNESLLVKQKIDEAIENFIVNQDDLYISRYDASLNDFNLQEVLDDCWTIPFLTRYKVVVISNAVFLTGNSTMSENDQQNLIDYLQNPSPDTIFILTGSFEKLDTRKKVVKSLSKNTQVTKCNQLDEQQFQAFVRQSLKNKHIELSNDTLEELLSRLKPDMQGFKNTLDKLILYPNEIDKSVIKRLVAKPLDDNVFSLVDAVMRKDLKSAMHIWHDLQVINTDPIGLVSLIGGHFRLLYQVKVLSNQNLLESEIVSTLKVHPYRIKLALKSVRNISNERLSMLILQSANLDQSLKLGLIEKTLGFENFLIRITKGEEHGIN